MTHPILMYLLNGQAAEGLKLYGAIHSPTAVDQRWAGYALYSTGQLLEAKDLLLQAVGRGHTEAGVELATVYRHLGDLASAQHTLDQVGPGVLAPFDRVLALRERGALLQGEGHLTEAARVLEQAWSVALSDAQCLPLRAQTAQVLDYVYGQRGLDVQARHYLDQALRLAPLHRRIQPLASLGLTLTYLAQYQEAEKALEEAMGLLNVLNAEHNLQTTVRYALATLRRAQGLWQDALNLYQDVARRARAQADSGMEFFALLGAAAIETATGQTEAAERLLRQSSRLATTPRRHLFWQWRQGTLDCSRGEDTGVTLLTAARDGFSVLGLPRETGWAELHLAEAWLRLGNPAAADAALHGVVGAQDQLGGGHSLLLELRGLPTVEQTLQDVAPTSPLSQLRREWRETGHRAPILVEFLTLGQATLRVDGELLHLPLRQAVEVCTYLLSHPGTTRNRLLTALWPDASPDQAISYFHQVRHEVEKRVPGLSLAYDRRARTYTVRSEGVRLEWDTQQVKRDLREQTPQHLNRALDRYAGPFLPQANSEWAQAERDALEWDLIRTGLLLMRTWSDEQQWQKCHDLARRLLTIDPVNEALAEYLLLTTMKLEGMVASRQVLEQLSERFEQEIGALPPVLKTWQENLAVLN